MTKELKPVKKSSEGLAQKFSHIQPEGSWEIPRKAFHYSIGFLVLYLYKEGYDTVDIYPKLTAFLCLVLTGEALRFSVPSFNVLYCNVLGPLMRKSEVSSRVNGVAYYLAGCIFALYLFPKDIASLSIVYLSWADPTASICGRLWGPYSPRFGKKSLAGTLGAIVIGAAVTFWFYTQFQGVSYDPALATVPLPVLALYGGSVAGLSEALGDSAGIDDNFVIPVISSVLLWIPLDLLDLGSSAAL